MSQQAAEAGLAATRTVHAITAADEVDVAGLEAGAVGVYTGAMCVPQSC